MKIGIGYPVYVTNEAHFDFAKQTLESVQSKDHEIVFCGVVNMTSKTEYDEYFKSKGTLLVNPENNVSMAWNKAIRELIDQGCDYVIVPNLDIVFKSDCIDNLVAFANGTKEITENIILWTAMPWNDLPTLENADQNQEAPETPHFSCFMVDARLLKEIGPFDEMFRPAYNEDQDMHWRIVLKGYKAVGYEGARFYHYGSRTIHSDPLLLAQNHITHDANNKYFLRKWGDKPATAADPFLTQRMFKTPFNRGWF